MVAVTSSYTQIAAGYATPIWSACSSRPSAGHPHQWHIGCLDRHHGSPFARAFPPPGRPGRCPPRCCPAADEEALLRFLDAIPDLAIPCCLPATSSTSGSATVELIPPSEAFGSPQHSPPWRARSGRHDRWTDDRWGDSFWRDDAGIAFEPHEMRLPIGARQILRSTAMACTRNVRAPPGCTKRPRHRFVINLFRCCILIAASGSPTSWSQPRVWCHRPCCSRRSRRATATSGHRTASFQPCSRRSGHGPYPSRSRHRSHARSLVSRSRRVLDGYRYATLDDEGAKLLRFS